jgi:hypothetical protein
MSSKPVTAIHASENSDGPLDPFDPRNLKLNQSFVEQTGVEKLLITVPVRKPRAQEFVRVHPSPDFRVDVSMIELQDEREQFIVAAPLALELISEVVNVTLYTAINRQGTVFLWPVRLPRADGRDSDWGRSAREAAALAMTAWIRFKANMELRAYEIFTANGTISEPQWPKESLWDLIRIGFRDKLIDRLDDPILQRLRGEI